jgi:hypothetical protein
VKKLEAQQESIKFNPKQAYTGYTDNIHKELEEQGVRFFQPKEKGGELNIDEGYLTLPKDITAIISNDLSNHLGAFTQQKMYMRTLLGYAEVFVDKAKWIYFNQSKDLYRELTHNKISEAAKERLLLDDKKIAECYEKLQAAQKKVILLKATIENIEDAIFFISREITRRSHDFDDENRAHNVGRYKV